MRVKLLSAVLLLGLGGCSHAPPVALQEPAGSWVDTHIEQSATSISLAQTRLHQTSAVRSFTPVSTPVPPAAAQPPAGPLPKPGG